MIAALLSKLPAPRPADWGFNVTVCIASVFDQWRKIVTVVDTKVGFGDFSADMAVLKDIPIHLDYAALVAGDDIEHAPAIPRRATEMLALKKDATPMDVAVAVDNAYAERLHSEIVCRILRKRGFSVESFVEKGRQKCTPSMYVSLCNRIDQVKLSLKFLVCGFDEDGNAHLFEVDGESSPKNYDPTGVWAIGHGAHAALSSLAYHIQHGEGFSYAWSEEKAIYLTITAKFMAESSDAVGRIGTFVCVREKGKENRYVSLEDVENIRNLWLLHGAPRVPSDLAMYMKDWRAIGLNEAKPKVKQT